MPDIIAFGEFELDECRFELRRAGQLVRVQPKVLRLLMYLATHRQRSVSTQELLRALWPGERVTIASIKRAVGGARRALGESAESQSSIRTVRGHGYQFVRTLATVEMGPEPAHESARTFVGREGFVDQLEACAARARAGAGQLCLVSGEPGIGKTRLLQELAHRAAVRGGRAWLGRCTDDEGAPALWPFIQIMRSAAEELGMERMLHMLGSGAPELAAAFPELRGMFPQLPAPPEIGSSEGRFRLFDSMVSYLERVAKDRSLCLLLDDIHHADALTVSLLRFIGHNLERCPILLVASLRGVPGPTPALDGLLRLSTATQMQLTGLSSEEIARWLSQRSGGRAPAQRVQQLHEQTAGNPLFLERLWHAQTPEGVAAHGLQGAIEDHLSRLDASTQEALRAAAVLGREFSVSRLAVLMETSAAALTQPLAVAVSAGLLQTSIEHPERHAFVHALIRDALYAQLPARERARLHERAAELLQASGHEPLSQIAEHAARAAAYHGPERALQALRRAAAAALERAAFEEAAGLYARARTLLELAPPDPGEQLELLIAQGEALARAGEAEGARVALREAAALAHARGQNDELVRAAMGLAQLSESGSVDAARVAVLEQAIAVCGPDDPRKICLEALLAKLLIYSRDRAHCTRLSRSALHRSHQLQAPRLRAQTLIACFQGLTEPECLAERKQIGEDLARIGHEHDDCRALAWSAIARVSCAVELGDLAEVDAGVATLEALATQARDPAARWYGMGFRAMREIWAAQLSDAVRWASAAYQYGLQLGAAGARHAYCTQMATVMRLQGRFAEAETLVREVSLSHPAIAGWQAVLACLEAEQGRTEQPRKVLERLVERELAALRRDPFALSVIAATADLCLLVGDAALARPIYDALRPFEDRHGSISVGLGTHGPLARHLGRLAVQMHQMHLAEQHFGRALALAEAMRSPLYTSLSLLGHAHLLLVARARNTSRAETLIARAMELGRSHELHAITRHAAALAALLGQGTALTATPKA